VLLRIKRQRYLLLELAAVQLTTLIISRELSIVRVRNQGITRNLILKAIPVLKGGQVINRNLSIIAVPDAHDLTVTVTDWNTLDMQAIAVPF
jgi:hypothetical protein